MIFLKNCFSNSVLFWACVLLCLGHFSSSAMGTYGCT
jgi:hypothetical protein